ncbi:hypothetical protein OnM2_046021 [Erysiphe neolycopersici]|uniref:Carrier domain-containing protein n=1 Tax=Erysiphe neolycopersici TaxID=212602 RepID=A0A420HTX0_9PEZI|nr:hypothetical protein OnM2_046021 [Erysiphe neolycopersici]
MESQQISVLDEENFALRFLELSSEIVLYDNWISQIERTKDAYSCFDILLNSIPRPDYPSLLSATCFLAALKRNHGSWLKMEVINAYTRLRQDFSKLNELAVNPHLSNALAQELEGAVNEYIRSPASLFTTSNSPALIDPLSKRSLSHHELCRFIQNFEIPISPGRQPSGKPTVAIALPNGFTLGLACLAVSCQYIAAPVDISGGATQLQRDVELIRPQVILSRSEDVKRLRLDQEWMKINKITLLVLDQDSKMTFSVRRLEDPTTENLEDCYSSYGIDIAFILLTSGSTGTKKVVPVSTLSLLTGTSCIITSWGLKSQDVCLNMMPLNHIGGLVRNLFAPVLSGGSTILCPVFDPNLFWDLVTEGEGTWYYASPSMHTSILSEKDFRDNISYKKNIRLVCNASGALLPSLATRLRDVFDCTVLPSYGMTECMPISTPPLNYNLERPGTSGISCGPDVAIFNNDSKPLPTGEIGHIYVRGGPTFAGYLQNGKIDTESLSESGWFNTGDLGYLDADGYLFLTGRSKEVINRGGEIISPFEVEEAIILASNTTSSPLHQRVKAALAFSTPHYLLQEVVGVIIVPHEGKLRPDLRTLHTSLKDILHKSKLPALVVYMNELPTNNNKVVRVKLSERMDLEPIRENTKFFEKHFNATCSPPNSSLDKKIDKIACSLDAQQIKETIIQYLGANLDLFVREQPQSGLAEIIIYLGTDCVPKQGLKESIIKHLQEHLHGYQVPADIIFLDSPIPRNNFTKIDEIELEKKIHIKNSIISFSEIQLKIVSAISNVLDIPTHVIKLDSDFFQLGGDSLSAGRLLSTLRRDYQIRIPIHRLFNTSKVRDLSELVEKLDSVKESQPETDFLSLKVRTIRKDKTYSNTNPILLIIQLLPIILFYPLKLAFWFTMFIYTLSFLSRSWRDSDLSARYITLIVAITVSSFSSQIAAPVLGIMLKWIIIGRYKAGNYPMWGIYHTRWWIVDKILLVCGKGIFKYTRISMLMYYRALGARIGCGVVIEPDTQLGEYDLLKIDDNVHLNRCICRPFACESNTQIFLGEIRIGRDCSIGLKSYVAPGSFIPANTYIGPNTSTYEKDDPVEDHQGATYGKLPKPHFLLRVFAIFPLQMIVLFISSLPWMIALIGVVESKPAGNARLGVLTIIRWWALPRRIAFHYVAAVSHVILSPLFRLVCIIFIKNLLDKICGKKKSCSIENLTSLEIFRTGLMDALEPNKSFHVATKLFGSHYEATSIAARALGAKVGKGVYWPGTGPHIDDFDLLDIGDHVVFGSRSYLVNRDGHGSLGIKIEAGAMIADRVVLSPGTTIGYRAVMGSGATTRRNQFCPSDSVWIGKKNGNAVCLTQAWPLNVDRENENKSPSTLSEKSGLYNLKASVSTKFSNKEMCIDNQKSLIKIKDDVNESSPKSKIKSSLSNGSASRDTSILDDKETISPFGRAFYNHDAPYYVFTMPIIIFYTTLITAVTKAFWDTNVIANLLLFVLLKHTKILERRHARSFIIYSFNVCFISLLLIFKSLLTLMIIIAAKWIIIGRRQIGNYDWDKSSYCQRWKLFLSIETLRSRCFGGNGILSMITGTYYIVLYYRLLGAKIGSNTAIFAGGPPSAYLTEPDLLTIGNRVAIDDASLVAHINSRGNFDLRTLSVEDGAVLRSGSRLLSGASIGREGVLLEHTLIMAGDRADDELVYQGWPAEVFTGIRP